jgi:hypothetical protein
LLLLLPAHAIKPLLLAISVLRWITVCRGPPKWAGSCE